VLQDGHAASIDWVYTSLWNCQKRTDPDRHRHSVSPRGGWW